MIINTMQKKKKNGFNKNRIQTDEIIRNTINYFTKSEVGYINFEDKNSVQYFLDNKIDLLYIKIYEDNYEEITKKYNIMNTKKIKFEKKTDEDYNKLSENKKELYDYLCE